VREGALLLWLGLLATGNSVHGTDPPRLPAGLGDSWTGDAPSVPTGLEHDGSEGKVGEHGDQAQTEPLDAKQQSQKSKSGWGTFEQSGFLDTRAGMRTQDDPYEDQLSLGETRLQLRLEKSGEWTRLRLVTDLLYDATQDSGNVDEVDLYRNRGFLDLREASATFHASDHLDLKAGRQILTWGTGDMVFVNDLFPKDWQSFFVGRDVEYLKAPTDAIKFSLFSSVANMDFVYTPRFVADRYLDGSRISFFNPALDDFIGEDNTLKVEQPDDWFSDDEFALRLYRTIGSYELAAYGYHGYWNSPSGYQPATDRYTFPALSVYGASVRGPVIRGIGNIEFGYYDSTSDSSGNDPLVRNSELRFLVGYEQEVARNFNVGLQYYLEYMMDYDAYRSNLPPDTQARDEERHLLTLRLTYLALNQDLKLSLFTYWSPSDEDGYTRPLVEYKLNDQLTMQAGANWFFGRYNHTFFGQLEDNSNVYLAVRYNFSFD